jgi:hypothetical protein
LKFFLLLLSGLVHNLVFSLLKLVILKIKNLLKAETLLRVAISLESIKNFWKLSLSNDGVLKLSNCLISKYDMTFVYSELKWQEENWHIDSLVLSNLDNL